MERVICVTLAKEKAVEMIRRMPENNMLYVINILKNLEEMSGDRGEDQKKAERALEAVLNLEKRLPENFNFKKELEEAREERYDDFS